MNHYSILHSFLQWHYEVYLLCSHKLYCHYCVAVYTQFQGLIHLDL
nr:MAG TPA: hypothetical protein [Crassvirales sp.]